VVCIVVAVLLVLFGLFIRERLREFGAAVSSAESIESIRRTASDIQTRQSAKKSSNKPLAQAAGHAKSNQASQELRDAFASETQKELWREGMEMTFAARGSTLHIEYVLAGKAFAFQFGESFIGDNRDMLRELGFKRVVLSDGNLADDAAVSHEWSWDLTK